MRRKVAVLTLAALVAAGLYQGARAQDTLPDISPSAQMLLDIARVDLPPKGLGLQLHIDWPAERPFDLNGVDIYSLTADIDSQGGVFVRNAVTGASAVGQTDEAAACADPTYRPLGVAWAADSLPVRWRFNIKSVPDRNSDFMTLRSIRLAHQVWPRVRTNCSDPDDNGFHFDFRGLTSRRVKYDRRNVVDFGKVGGGALALAYTWFADRRIVEVDLRLNRHDYRWTNHAEGRKAYNVLNVATHEIGHHLGLDDLSDPHGGLTMFGRIGRGETSKVTLGKGDMRGAANLSP